MCLSNNDALKGQVKDWIAVGRSPSAIQMGQVFVFTRIKHLGDKVFV